MSFKNFALCLVLMFMVSGNVAQAQSLPKIRAAYTSIAIQFDPIYIMKELDLPRKYGLDAEMLYVRSARGPYKRLWPANYNLSPAQVSPTLTPT